MVSSFPLNQRTSFHFSLLAKVINIFPTEILYKIINLTVGIVVASDADGLPKTLLKSSGTWLIGAPPSPQPSPGGRGSDAIAQEPVDRRRFRECSVDDRELRTNRLRLLGRIRVTLDRVADFSKIEG